MAGAFLQVGVNDAVLQGALEHAMKASADLQPAFHRFGFYLKSATQSRFENARAPQGWRWPALSKNTKKKRNQRKILVLWGDLYGSFHFRSSPKDLELGTNVAYAARHQFGFDGEVAVRPHFRKSSKGRWYGVNGMYQHQHTPARPFLGLSAVDRIQFLATLQNHLLGGLK